VFDTLARPTRFTLVGVANTLVDVGVFATVIACTTMSPVVANIAGYSAGIVNSYVLNRNWTFADRRDSGLWQEFARFLSAGIATMSLSTFTVWATAPAVGSLPAKIASVMVVFAFSYLLNRVFVFPPARTPSNEPM